MKAISVDLHNESGPKEQKIFDNVASETNTSLSIRFCHELVLTLAFLIHMLCKFSNEQFLRNSVYKFFLRPFLNCVYQSLNLKREDFITR